MTTERTNLDQEQPTERNNLYQEYRENHTDQEYHKKLFFSPLKKNLFVYREYREEQR